MSEMLAIPFMRTAVAAGLLLAAVLAYLGIHVVRRRIVFVDLAIAQLSAVGVTIGLLLEKDPVIVSMAVTLAGAALLSLPARERRIPQEAIMGIVYAVATAAAVLLIARMPHGEADLMNLFFGNILAVTPGQIGLLGSVSGAAVLAHAFFAKRLTPSSQTPEGVSGGEWAGWGWNLFFYLTLALVITVAIRTAGVLLVFSDLIIPAVTALLWVHRWFALILVSVTVGLVGNAAGFYASYRFDLPAGPAIVACLGGGLLLAAVGRGLARLTFRSPSV
jgi:ABC-type Mn2+/Zn2+ transport system permease subunit